MFAHYSTIDVHQVSYIDCDDTIVHTSIISKLKQYQETIYISRNNYYIHIEFHI